MVSDIAALVEAASGDSGVTLGELVPSAIQLRAKRELVDGWVVPPDTALRQRRGRGSGRGPGP